MNGQLSSLAQISGLRNPRHHAYGRLLLESHAESIAGTIDDVIVSLDGPPAVHDIYAVFPTPLNNRSGRAALRQFPAGYAVVPLATVQKANHRLLCEVVQRRRQWLELDFILAADLTRKPLIVRRAGYPNAKPGRSERRGSRCA